MGRRSTIDLLPAPVREELDCRLIRTAYGDYDGHHAWLQAEGHQVSRSALARYALRTRKTRTAVDREIAKVKAASEFARALQTIARAVSPAPPLDAG